MNREIKDAFEELLQERMGDAEGSAESANTFIEKVEPIIENETVAKSSIITDPLRTAAEGLAKKWEIIRYIIMIHIGVFMR